MKLLVTSKRFTDLHLGVIAHANAICTKFIGKGYDLTLRQIYYQFVGHDLFPDEWAVRLPDGAYTKNHESTYKKLGGILSDARRAGLLDWDYMIDRHRSSSSRTHWSSPQELLNHIAPAYTIDLWSGQDRVPEVWVEKDALIGVIKKVTRRWDVTSFSTKGYPSDSALFEAATSIVDRFQQSHQRTVIFHFADHDPSGVDMTRAIQDTLTKFVRALGGTWGEDIFEVHRKALMIDQTDDLPPSPAKVTDSRTSGYVATFGTDDAWELDAIEPDKLADWVDTAIQDTIDDHEEFEARRRAERQGQDQIREVALQFDSSNEDEDEDEDEDN